MQAPPLDAPHFFRDRFAPTLGERVAAVLRELLRSREAPPKPPRSPEPQPDLRGEIMKDLCFGRT